MKFVPDVLGGARALLFTMWSSLSRLVVLILPMRLGGGCRSRRDSLNPIGWASAGVFDRLACSRSSIKAQAGRIARLVFLGDVRLGRVMLGARPSGRGRGPRILYLRRANIDGARADEQAQARQGGLIWRAASIVPAMAERPGSGAYAIGPLPRHRLSRDCSALMSEWEGCGCARIPRCRRGLDAVCYGARPKGVKAWRSLYPRAMRRQCSRVSLISYRTQLHRYFSRGRRWPAAAGASRSAYNKPCLHVRCRRAGGRRRLARFECRDIAGRM